jgi:hypothetical protein
MKRPSELGMRSFSNSISYGWGEFAESVATVPYGLHCLIQVLLMPLVWPALYIRALYIDRRGAQ